MYSIFFSGRSSTPHINLDPNVITVPSLGMTSSDKNKLSIFSKLVNTLSYHGDRLLYQEELLDFDKLNIRNENHSDNVGSNTAKPVELIAKIRQRINEMHEFDGWRLKEKESNIEWEFSSRFVKMQLTKKNSIENVDLKTSLDETFKFIKSLYKTSLTAAKNNSAIDPFLMFEMIVKGGL